MTYGGLETNVVEGSIPPVELRAFFAKYRQKERRLSSGQFVRMPLHFWGDGVLGLNGTVPLAIAVPYLKRLGKRPTVIPGPGGPAALAGILSPSYLGSSVGPYRSFFFGLGVEDPGWNPARPEPGYHYVQFYDSTEISTLSGELWGMNKIHAPVTSEFNQRARCAQVELDGKLMVRMRWRLDGRAPHAIPVEKRFHTFPEKGAPGSRLLVVGSDANAPYRPGFDELYCDPKTKLGRLLDEMHFVPRFWGFTAGVHGVYFPP